jgi:Ca2+-binding RTX toxin-like protein
MSGGDGDDTYIVDETGDRVVEAASDGTDTIRSAVTYTLPANVENLRLTGSAVASANGNELANALTGMPPATRCAAWRAMTR